MIADAIQEKSTDAEERCGNGLCADAGMIGDKFKATSNFIVKKAPSRRPVGLPPRCRLANLLLGAGDNPNREWQSLVPQLFQQVPAVGGLAFIGLSDGSFEPGRFFRR